MSLDKVLLIKGSRSLSVGAQRLLLIGMTGQSSVQEGVDWVIWWRVFLAGCSVLNPIQFQLIFLPHIFH
jgi:hypothetical protein